MPYWFHGTEESNAEKILKEGFRKRTFFAKHLDVALRLGCGEVMFWVWFDEDPTEYWEWVACESIGPEKIRSVARLNPDLIYDNKELEIKIRRDFFKENHPDAVFCERCEGRGELTEAPFFRVKKRPLKVCPVCGGFGRVRKDGRKINDPEEETT